MTTILFAGGGSGGHLFPGVAVAEELLHRGLSFRSVFVGSNRSLEERILKANEFEHFSLGATPSSAFVRSPIHSLIKNWRAYRSSLEILDALQPNVVVGLGGFASVPIVFGAWRRKVPVLLLEQNAVLGRANRLLLPLSQSIGLSFSDTPLPAKYQGKTKPTGNPLRRTFQRSASFSKEHADEPPQLLIMGGSQGAAGVNEATLGAIPKIREELANWRIVHQTGIDQENHVQTTYARLGVTAEVTPFLDDIKSVYEKSKLVVSRAGATSLAEFAACGLPALLIPYPNSIRDHQKRNAEYYARNGGAVLIEQSSQIVEVLASNLRFLLTDRHRCEAMGRTMFSLAKPEAASDVVDLVLSLTQPRLPSGATELAHNEAVDSSHAGH